MKQEEIAAFLEKVTPEIVAEIDARTADTITAIGIAGAVADTLFRRVHPSEHPKLAWNFYSVLCRSLEI